MTETYGARLRMCRQAAGLTQTQLAQRLQLTRSSIANIEAGRQHSMVEDVARYADVLGVDAAWLAYGRVTVEGRPLPKPRTVASADLITLSEDLQKLAARAAALAAIANPAEVEEEPLTAEPGE